LKGRLGVSAAAMNFKKLLGFFLALLLRLLSALLLPRSIAGLPSLA